MKRELFVFFLAFCAVSASFAQSFDFTITNDTGLSIDAVYASPAAQADWGESVLDDGPIEDQGVAGIVFDPEYEAILLAAGTDSYDLKVFFDDGSSREWDGLSLGTISALTLSLDGKGILITSTK